MTTTPARAPSRVLLRRELRGRRRALARTERRAAARGLAAWLDRQPELRRAARIAVYLSNDGEIDLGDLVDRVWKRGRPELYLPVLADRPAPRLRFARYLPGMRLVANRFGIPEPPAPRRELLKAREIDLLLMPLVAFDADGNRLGMGGGYFDRTLAFRHHASLWRRPRLVGVAYAFQQVAALPAEAWDVPLDAVVTELGPVPLRGR